MPAPSPRVSFSVGVEALRRMEEQRTAREDRMRNALEILEGREHLSHDGWRSYAQFVRATAREGLGRDGVG